MPREPYLCACGAAVDGFSFCPVCGRRAARLTPTAPVSVRLPAGQRTFTIPLSKAGPGVLPYRARVRGAGLLLRYGAQGRLADSPQTLTLEIAEGAPDHLEGALILETANAARAERWWDEDVFQALEVPVRVSRAAPASVRVPARRLAFPEGAPVQALSIWNTGEAEAEASLQLPPGFAREGAEGAVRVPPGGFSTVEIRRTGSARGTLRIAAPGGEFAVALEPIEARRAGGPQPDIIVGLDFGTSNSSILLRDRRTETVQAVGPADPDTGLPLPRFPSVLWVGARGAAAVGAEALERQARGEDGFLVRGIKTLMRQEEDPYTRYGVSYTTQRLLTIFLGEMKRLLDEALAARGEGDFGQVLYVFCLPVLDNGERYRAQEGRMRDAARAAGFPVDEPGAAVFLAEPVAAALCAARSLERVAGLAPGSRLCVVDSGGGTTDVTMGEVVTDERGRYGFRPDAVGALIPPAYPEVEAIRTLLGARGEDAAPELGGDTYDMLLLARWMRQGKIPAEPWEALWPSDAYEGALEDRPALDVRVGNVLDGVRSIKEELCGEFLFAPMGCDADDLRARFRCTSRDPQADARLAANARLLFPVEVSFDYEADISPLAREVWEAPGVGPELRALARAEGAEAPVGVAAVGGSNHMPAQRAQCRQWAGVDLIDMRDRDTAVVTGSLLAYDYYPAGTLPFPLEARTTHGEESGRRALLHAYQRPERFSPLRKTWELAPGEWLTVDVLAGGDGEPLASCQVEAEERMEVTVRAEREPLDEIVLEGISAVPGPTPIRISVERSGRVWPVWEARL
ncbi:MAG TPA: hypothetical protein VGM37_05890 [Armatimonadota bacterium]|jgi:hypothetical protein